MQEEQNQIQDCIVEAAHPKKNTDDAIQNSEKQPAIKIEKVNVTKGIAKAIKRRGALRKIS